MSSTCARGSGAVLTILASGCAASAARQSLARAFPGLACRTASRLSRSFILGHLCAGHGRLATRYIDVRTRLERTAINAGDKPARQIKASSPRGQRPFQPHGTCPASMPGKEASFPVRQVQISPVPVISTRSSSTRVSKGRPFPSSATARGRAATFDRWRRARSRGPWSRAGPVRHPPRPRRCGWRVRPAGRHVHQQRPWIPKRQRIDRPVDRERPRCRAGQPHLDRALPSARVVRRDRAAWVQHRRRRPVVLQRLLFDAIAATNLHHGWRRPLLEQDARARIVRRAHPRRPRARCLGRRRRRRRARHRPGHEPRRRFHPCEQLSPGTAHDRRGAAAKLVERRYLERPRRYPAPQIDEVQPIRVQVVPVPARRHVPPEVHDRAAPVRRPRADRARQHLGAIHHAAVFAPDLCDECLHFAVAVDREPVRGDLQRWTARRIRRPFPERQRPEVLPRAVARRADREPLRRGRPATRSDPQSDDRG